MTDACCAHRTVSFRTEDFIYDGPEIPAPKGSVHVPLRKGATLTKGWWECDSGCGTRFVPDIKSKE